MKITKKEQGEIREWIGNYFCDVILPICYISGYELVTIIEPTEDGTRTFSVKVSFPYRVITLYVRERGIEYYRKKDFKTIRQNLFHEAFHVIIWRYKEYAETRFVDGQTMLEMEEDIADRFSFILESLYENNKEKRKN